MKLPPDKGIHFDTFAALEAWLKDHDLELHRYHWVHPPDDQLLWRLRVGAPDGAKYTFYASSSFDGVTLFSADVPGLRRE